jgi:5-methylthioadenosine/S-adenosylhomocysteine deaminase
MILVRAGQLVTGHDASALRNGAVAVSGQKIIDIGPYQDLAPRYPDAKKVGDERFLLIPGLINGHGHGRGLTPFQRGVKDDSLEKWIWDTRTLTTIPTYENIAFSALKLLKCGVTTTMHNHLPIASGSGEEEWIEALEAYKDSGIRLFFCPAARNDNPLVYGDNGSFTRSLPQELRELALPGRPPGELTGEHYIKTVRNLHRTYDNPMTRIGFGPLAPQWCTEELLLQVKQEATRLAVPVHLHTLETIYQKIYSLKYLGKTLIESLKDMELLGPRIVLGHCVWPTQKDIQLLARSGTGVTHHPSSNLRLRAGISPVFHMLQSGVLVGLGVDGTGINDDDDMIQEMKVCYLLHRIPSLELDSPYLEARQVFRMATENNAALLGFGRELGRLEPGAWADMVLLDYERMCSPYVDPSHDPIDVLLYRGKSNHVHTVMVNGRVVVDKGEVLTLNEEQIGKRLNEAASRPQTNGEQALAKGLRALNQRVAGYYKGWSEKIDTKPYFAINSRSNGLR